jgi:hypothetical protein
MRQLGLWVFLAALFALAIIFLPPLSDEGGDAMFPANALFCDDVGTANLTLTLSEEALAKGRLDSILNGFCARPGAPSSPIETQRFTNVLTVLGGVMVAGLVMMFLGRNARRGSGYVAAAQNRTTLNANMGVVGETTPTLTFEQRARQRDTDDARAQYSANSARAAAAAAAAAAPRPTTAPARVADWQIGMPSFAPASRPSERFSFDESSPPILDNDRQIQLNLLQLAYESSLITRSEYDARRDALLRTASAEGSGER